MGRVFLFLFSAISVLALQSLGSQPLEKFPNVLILMDGSVHPENGGTQYKVMNPNGSVDLQFAERGVRLFFQSHDNRKHEVRIFFDHQHPKNQKVVGEGPYRSEALQAYKMADRKAPINFYNVLSQGIPQGAQLVLVFRHQNKPGFHFLDYESYEVESAFIHEFKLPTNSITLSWDIELTALDHTFAHQPVYEHLESFSQRARNSSSASNEESNGESAAQNQAKLCAKVLHS